MSIKDITSLLEGIKNNLEDVRSNLAAKLGGGRERLRPEENKEISLYLKDIDSLLSKNYILIGEFERIQAVESKLSNETNNSYVGGRAGSPSCRICWNLGCLVPNKH